MPVLPIPATAAGSSSIHLINILPATLYATPPASASSLESKADKLEKEEVQGVELKDAVEDVFPEGGLSAYLAVCGSFLIIGATFGLSNCYGVLQAYFSLVRRFNQIRLLSNPVERLVFFVNRINYKIILLLRSR